MNPGASGGEQRAVRAEHENSGQAAAVGDAAGGEHRDRRHRVDLRADPNHCDGEAASVRPR